MEQMITTLGFPVACVVVLGYYLYKRIGLSASDGKTKIATANNLPGMRYDYYS